MLRRLAESVKRPKPTRSELVLAQAEKRRIKMYQTD